ncbi:MAG: hypothetical protein JNL70_12900 [Saprospiraceae bacterium]|nr:hypothetical protein [Saprospiraceae bacterium]
MKNPRYIILLVNLTLLLTIFAYKPSIYGLAEAIHVVGLFVLNVLTAVALFILKKGERGKDFLLAAGLLLLIGFGVCVLKLS